MKTNVLSEIVLKDPLDLVSYFFYYTMLDDKKYLKACKKTLTELSEVGFKKSPFFFEKFVQYTYKYWLRYYKQDISLLENNKQFSQWTHSFYYGRKEDFLVVLWQQILGISEEDIAKGLNVSVGTVSYRKYHGIKALGKFCLDHSIESLSNV